MYKAALLSAVFFIAFLSLKSQNLTGTWEGTTSDGGDYWRIGIIHSGDSCFGYSYDSIPGYCYQNFSASFNKREKKLEGRGISFMASSEGHVLIAVTLRYTKKGADELLTGDVKDKSLQAKISSFMADYGELRKVSSHVDTTLYMKAVLRRLQGNKTADSIKKQPTQKDSAVVPVKITDSLVPGKKTEDSLLQVKNSRATLVTKTIYTSADSVTIFLYDDGEIDGDMVTIFDNGKIVVNKLMLSKEPYRITLTLPLNDSKHSIELMAENEGSIPPNTAYMLVLAGNERVEVKASSDKLSNAAIVIQKNK